MGCLSQRPTRPNPQQEKGSNLAGTQITYCEKQQYLNGMSQQELNSSQPGLNKNLQLRTTRATFEENIKDMGYAEAPLEHYPNTDPRYTLAIPENDKENCSQYQSERPNWKESHIFEDLQERPKLPGPMELFRIQSEKWLQNQAAKKQHLSSN